MGSIGRPRTRSGSSVHLVGIKSAAESKQLGGQDKSGSLRCRFTVVLSFSNSDLRQATILRGSLPGKLSHCHRSALCRLSQA